MKVWLFGKEIPYFKPLRHEIDAAIKNKIEVSQELLNQGWTKENTIQLIMKKGFLDPNYPNYIRTAEYLITIQQFTVEKIEPINSQSKELKERLPVFYIDFAQNQSLVVNSTFANKGMFPLWVEEDLKADGKFLKKQDDIFYFSTRFFVYKISNDYELMEILEKETMEKIEEIRWFEDRAEIIINSQTIHLNNDYIQWLCFLIFSYDYTWSLSDKIPDKITNRIDELSLNWVIHPNVWKTLQVKSEEEKGFFLELFLSDWRKNAFIISQRDRKCEVVGWRFSYEWDGFILKSIYTPAKKVISTIEIKNNLLVLNQQVCTSLLKDRPEDITDLVEGNLVCMLTMKRLQQLTLHPHAIQRYEERIEENSLTFLMLQDIIYNVYHFAIVVDGAHTDERRKVETDRYGYVISDTMVISVWDKQNSKKKKKSKKKSSRLKHLEHMSDLFNQIKK